MLTLFDRYLLQRYWHAFFITFLSLWGLFVIIDAFTNVDEFARQGKSVLDILGDMAWYYLLRGCAFFNAVGSMIAIISAMLVLAVVQRCGELNPILSAGIPTYRLARPILLGAMLVNLVIIANQELLIPRIAGALQLKPGNDGTTSDKLKPLYDFSTHILIASGQVYWKTHEIQNGEFVLPAAEIANALTRLQVPKASYIRHAETGRGGWLLSGVSPRFDEISLTPLGRATVFPGPEADQIFIATDITFDELMSRNKLHAYLSTRELLARVRNPSFGTVSARSQSIQLHARFTGPLLNMLVVLLVLPLIVRRESGGLVTNLATCIGTMLFVLGTGQAFQYLGAAHFLPLSLAAWGPVMLCGVLSAWCADSVRT